MSAGSALLMRRPPRKRLRPPRPARRESSELRASARTAGSPLPQVPSATASSPRTPEIRAWDAVDDAYGTAHRLQSP
jgi:hypothetical protein